MNNHWKRPNVPTWASKASIECRGLPIVIIIIIIVSLNHPRVKIYMCKKNAFVYIYKTARTRYVLNMVLKKEKKKKKKEKK